MTDGSTDQRRFDPRFDPAFQPGYDPRNDPSMPARTVAREQGAPRAEFVPAPPERMPIPQHRAQETPERDEVRSPREQEPAEDVSPRGTNPYVIVLWVVSVVLVAAGIALLRAIPAIEEQASGTGGQAGFVQMFAYANLSAALIAAGLVVAAGTLFLLALRWRGRIADQDD